MAALRSLSGLLLLLPVVSGCPAEKRDVAPDTTRVGQGTPRLPRDTAAVFAPVNDADIRMLVALINVSEIGAGTIAVRKATVADVRTFAADMIADHSAMQQTTGADTSGGAGTSPAGQARADTLRRIARRQSDSLTALPRGAAFDRAYIDQQLSAHSMALDSLTRWSSRARNEQVRAMVTAALPKVQSHLDRARVIQASLGGVIHAAHRTGVDTMRPPRPPPDTTRR